MIGEIILFMFIVIKNVLLHDLHEKICFKNVIILVWYTMRQ